MAAEVYIDLPEMLVADIEGEGVEEVERFRTSDLAQAVNVVVGVAAFSGNVATVALAAHALRDFACKLTRSVLRHSPPVNPSVQLELAVRGASGTTAIKVDITRGAGGDPIAVDVDAVVAALSAAYADAK